MDSVQLEEIQTFAPLKKYRAAVKLQHISSADQQRTTASGLEDLLSRYTSLYFKSNAGGLSTIRFRGSSANQTTVNFGGLTLNSLTLGQADFSNIPVYLFDQVDLIYGSSSVSYGSGAIGGTVKMGLAYNWTHGVKAEALASAGSYGKQIYGTKLFVGNGKLESVTRFYYLFNENNFRFKNTNTQNVEQRGGIADRQHGASIKNYGLIQEFNYRFEPQQTFKSSVWLERDWHQVQPNTPSNYTYSGNAEELLDRYMRLWTVYEDARHELKYKLGGGYVHDMEIDDGNTTQKIGTDRGVFSADLHQDFHYWGYRLGLKYSYIHPRVYAYSDSVVTHEQRFTGYLSSYWQLLQKLRLTFNIRNEHVSHFSAPLTPSLGAEYLLSATSWSSLKLTGSLSRSYRIPTFNDRYWGNQGNRKLKSEDGRNAEAGVNYWLKTGKLTTNFKVNTYFMNVKNWIEWRMKNGSSVEAPATIPDGTWIAQNVARVVSKGVEFLASSVWHTPGVDYKLNLGMNVNSVVAKKDINSSEGILINKQLTYSPRYMGNIRFLTDYKNWELMADSHYTGSRYTDDASTDRGELNAYWLINTTVNYCLKFKKQTFRVGAEVRNLGNVNYQNQKLYAMPRRTFQLSLRANIE